MTWEPHVKVGSDLMKMSIDGDSGDDQKEDEIIDGKVIIMCESGFLNMGTLIMRQKRIAVMIIMVIIKENGNYNEEDAYMT